LFKGRVMRMPAKESYMVEGKFPFSWKGEIPSKSRLRRAIISVAKCPRGR